MRYFGGSEQLAWAFQWVAHRLRCGGAGADVAKPRAPYTLKAAALAAGTLLTTPYLFMYDMMVLAIPIAFLVRIGLKTGFRAYELPALARALVALIALLHVHGHADAGLAPRWSCPA